MSSLVIYLIGCIFYTFVFIKQIEIIIDSSLDDFYFASKVIFMIRSLVIMIGFGYGLFTDDQDFAAGCFLLCGILSFWAYYLKKVLK